MTTEGPAGTPPRRPRTVLLVLLGIVLILAAAMTLRESAAPPPPTSNPGRAAQQQRAGERLDPAQLDVRLEALQAEKPAPDDAERNPFRFQPKAAPRSIPKNEEETLPTVAPAPSPPPGPPSPPPIQLKFIGVTEAPSVGKIAALSDCRHTVQGTEGEVIMGRYRIVKIGVESLMIEYLDGKGRTTLRMTGQECVGK
jgi:hypothetical protein